MSVFIKLSITPLYLPFIFCQNPINLPYRRMKEVNRICPFRSLYISEYLSWSLCSVSFLPENSGSVTYHIETLVWVLFVVYFWCSLILHVYGLFPSFSGNIWLIWNFLIEKTGIQFINSQMYIWYSKSMPIYV